LQTFPFVLQRKADYSGAHC